MKRLRLDVPRATPEEIQRGIAAAEAFLAEAGFTAEEAAEAWFRGFQQGAAASDAPPELWSARDERGMNAWLYAQHAAVDGCFTERSEEQSYRGWPLTLVDEHDPA